MSTETAEILDRAAKVIERNGWYQGNYYNQHDLDGNRSPADCPVCALGALNLALGASAPNLDVQTDGPAERALRYYLRIDSVADWNDAPRRTVEEVLAALRGAAVAERERVAAL